MVVESGPDSLHVDTSIPTPAIDVDIAVTAQVLEAEHDLPSHEIETEGPSSITEGDAVQDSSPSKFFVEGQPEAQVLEETSNTVIDDTNDLLTSTISSTAIAGEFIGDIPAVTNVISDESDVSAPLNEENHLQQFESTADLQNSDVIVIEDTQNVIPSHEPPAERNDISESTPGERILTDIYTSINAAIPASVEGSIDPNFELIASGDISKPESELPLSDGDTPPVDNLQDNTSHVDEMPPEVVEDKGDVAVEPSVVMVDAHIDTEPIANDSDVLDVADEHERSAMESHLEVVNPVRSDPIQVRNRSRIRFANTEILQSEFTAEPATAVISSLQDRTAAEMKVDSIEEVYTEVRESLPKL
jgi:hypothetical protein